MVPPPWVEMILMFEKRFLAPVATMLAIMRVVSNMNSSTDGFSPLSSVSEAFVNVGWTNRVAPRRFKSSNHGSNCGSPEWDTWHLLQGGTPTHLQRYRRRDTPAP